MEKKFPAALPDFHLTRTHIKLLKHAKRRIKSLENEHVCPAILNGAENPEFSGLKCTYADGLRAAADLKKFIRRAIESRIYFDTWQRAHGIRRTDEQVRGDRVKWINYILENAPGHDE